MKLLLTVATYLSLLYQTMALPDSVDYPQAFYEQNIRVSLQAREEMPWGKTIPEREWRTFVLPVRVNNENLDSSRVVFYREIGPRVRHLSMQEAILEVNHWCHERVTYTPSDERTSSPLASIRTAYGRCGEESTLLVAALRAVGIPARQVYTPRWAHTDDNHAWVEAWADGQWWFLGACEPEPVLNLGWFNAPASRAMLMHTKAIGHYDGPEHVMSRTHCYTEIDVTSNYAPVNQRIVRIVNEQGQPVEGADVSFRIYNYAEFYPVRQVQTNEAGLTSMSSGEGDLLVWASAFGRYGLAVCDMRLHDTLTVVLNHRRGERWSTDLTIVPPAERNNMPFVSDEQRAENNRRLAYEDSLRNAYIASFPATEQPLIRMARGNWRTIDDFLQHASTPLNKELFLETLREKDLRDITPEVLRAATLSPAANRGYDEDTYYRYVVCPRVANEMLTPYRPQLTGALTRQERKQMRSAEGIADWVRTHIRIDNRTNPQHLRMSPMGVYRHRVCDDASRNIFYVALSRTLGYAARINPVTAQVERYADGRWLAVELDADKRDLPQPDKGMLRADHTPDRYVLNPQYYSHFTLSRLDGGRNGQHPRLLEFAEDDTWESVLREGCGLDADDYLLTSGTRMADGSVSVHVEVVPVTAGQTVSTTLLLPQATRGLNVIGHLNSELLYRDEADGLKSILSTTGRGYYVLGIVAPNNEPSIHALRDIAAVADELDAQGRQMILLFSDQEAMDRMHRTDLPPLPACAHWGTDHEGAILQQLVEEMHLQQSPLPYFVIADTFNRIVYISDGYTIGLGATLLHHLQGL